MANRTKKRVSKRRESDLLAVYQAKIEKKERFCRVLAEFLVGNAAAMSVMLGVQPDNPTAQFWQRLRNETPLFGYPSVEDAVKVLMDFFST